MRNEDYDRELLVFVTLVCLVLAAVVSVLETGLRATKATPANARADQPPPATVRVIGTPFVPNTNPSVR
jgi:hypothetical protein